MNIKRKYIIKGDLSGIQNFIFDVKSKGAAKELKKRSLYVTQLAKDLLKEDESFFQNDDIKTIYIGGGNFFYQVETEKNEKMLCSYFEEKSKKYLDKDLFPFYAFVPYQGDFQKAMNDVNIAMLRKKQQREILLEPFIGSKESLPTELKGKGINFHFPQDEKGNLLDFDHLVKNGKGDDKLAALKLDVDYLGLVFRNKSENDYNYLSKKLNDFFDSKLLELIKNKKIGNQVYVVFSGGDDCFLIGCWNTIVQLVIDIREAFRELSNDLNNKIKDLNREITFSAGISIFTPTYPIRQLADEVDQYLNKAKREGRDRITIFGYSLTWDDYKKALDIQKQLYKLVEKKGESRSLIHRVKSSNIGYSALQKRVNKGVVNLPRVWNLKYYLRNVKKENQKEVEKLFNIYSSSLIDEFMNRKAATNSMVFPIAARLTELLIKKSS